MPYSSWAEYLRRRRSRYDCWLAARYFRYLPPTIRKAPTQAKAPKPSPTPNAVAQVVPVVQLDGGDGGLSETEGGIKLVVATAVWLEVVELVIRVDEGDWSEVPCEGNWEVSNVAGSDDIWIVVVGAAELRSVLVTAAKLDPLSVFVAVLILVGVFLVEEAADVPCAWVLDDDLAFEVVLAGVLLVSPSNSDEVDVPKVKGSLLVVLPKVKGSLLSLGSVLCAAAGISRLCTETAPKQQTVSNKTTKGRIVVEMSKRRRKYTCIENRKLSSRSTIRFPDLRWEYEKAS